MKKLSQLVVNKSDAARRRLSDSYAWHKMIWKSFPDHNKEKRHFLYRIDDAGRYFRILMLSAVSPVSTDLGQWNSKSIAPSFLSHDIYRFQVKANPTMRRFSDRRRLGIYSEEKLHQWMMGKAGQNGFTLLDQALIIGSPTDETFVRNRIRGKHVAVDFQGTLQVTDKTDFKQGFENGIGSAKSFGYGMLMLQPIQI